MRKFLLLIIALLGLEINISDREPWSNSPRRRKARRAALKVIVLTSTEMPAVRLEFDKEVQVRGRP